MYYPPFNTDVAAVNAGTKWIEYVNGYKRFVNFAGITNDQRLIDGLLHFAGEAIVDIYTTVETNTELVDTDREDTESQLTPKAKIQALKVDKFADVCAKLTAHFNPKRSRIYERHTFRQLRQKPDESVLQFVTRLRTAGKYCEFVSIDDEILSAVLSNGNSEWLTKKALESTSEPKLADVMKLALSKELSSSQAMAMRNPSPDELEEANFIGKARPSNVDFKNAHSRSSNGTSQQHVKREDTCGNCGRDAKHPKCPAIDSICRTCSRKGHWEQVCRSKDKPLKSSFKGKSDRDGREFKRQSNYIDYDKDEYAFSIGQKRSGYQLPKCNITVLNQPVEFVIDTGSSINIIDMDTYKSLLVKPELNKPISNAYGFNSSKPINFAGRFNTEVKYKDQVLPVEIHVLKYSSTSPNLLSFRHAEKLGIIKMVNSVVQDEMKECLKAKYPNLFSGKIGCLKDFELELGEDPEIKPSKRFHYRIPYHLQPQVEQLLEEREKGGLIEKATGPTTWISACHVVPKKDTSKVRLVIDARPVNKAIIRHRHICPTLDDITTRLNGSTVFSKVDFKEGYRQVLLAEKSRHLTVFSTHKGLYRDTRLSPGLNAGAEYFQLIVSEVLKGLDGQMNVSDDIIIYGKDVEEHDIRLHKLLERLESVGFTANLEKCEFRTKEIDFFGVNFSAAGMAPSEKRVEAFQKTSAPITASEVRSLLATANYSTRFINNFASIIDPLRDLTKSDSTPFTWLPEHQQAFVKLKAGLTTNKLAYFNPKWHTEVICDASPVGLGAILVQVNPDNPEERVIIAFASRTLSKLERKYSQVELEALALIFAVEKFHMYVYGKKFKLYSDAKAIVFIYGGMSHKSPARIERWGLRLLPYDFELIHTPGDGNPADFLSRHPMEHDHDECDDADLYVNFVVDNSVPRAVTREQIAKATHNDEDMRSLRVAIRSCDRGMVKKSKNLIEFLNVFDDLTVSTDGIILRRHQIVVPTSLRKTLVDIAHEGHLGIVKTKQMMRLKVWFPKLDQLVENRIANCMACQTCTPSNSKNMVPMRTEPVPDRVWHTVAGDFFGPLPSGHYLLGMICKTSGYPIVEICTTTSGRAAIPLIDKVFAEFGIPSIICSDNGPPFQGKEFKAYCEYLGIKHLRSTPLWPRGNAKIERFMKSLGKTVRIAQYEGKCWKQVLNQFLRSYRAAPHASTGVAPNQLMFGRNLTSRLPTCETTKPTPLLESALEKYKVTAEKNRVYTDKKLCTKPSPMKEGDQVLVRADRKNKLSPLYKPDKHTVMVRDKSWIMVKSNVTGKTANRNISFLKILKPDVHDIVIENKQKNVINNEQPTVDVNVQDGMSNETVDPGTYRLETNTESDNQNSSGHSEFDELNTGIGGNDLLDSLDIDGTNITDDADDSIHDESPDTSTTLKNFGVEAGANKQVTPIRRLSPRAMDQIASSEKKRRNLNKVNYRDKRAYNSKSKKKDKQDSHDKGTG